MPSDVGGAQRAALVRHIGKRGRQVAAAEPDGGAVEVVFARELEAERVRVGSSRLRSTIEWWLRSSTPRR